MSMCSRPIREACRFDCMVNLLFSTVALDEAQVVTIDSGKDP